MGHLVSNARIVVIMERVAVRDVGALDGVEEMSRNKSVLRAFLLIVLLLVEGVHDGTSSVVVAAKSTDGMGAATTRCCVDIFWRMLLDVASTATGFEEKGKGCGVGGANAIAK